MIPRKSVNMISLAMLPLKAEPAVSAALILTGPILVIYSEIYLVICSAGEEADVRIMDR